MKLTLLDMDQAILSSLGSDEVNSISDTTESLQVCEILKQTYFNILARSNLPMQEELFQLDDSLDVMKPVLMYRPDRVAKMEWVKYYDNATPPSDNQYKYVTILPIKQFIDQVNAFNPQETDVDVFNFTLDTKTFTFLYKNDKQPQFCAVLKNYYVIFDSFDSSVDSTLQGSKTMCYGEMLPQWSMTDSFVPDFDDQQFPLLLNEAKSLAFLELKQTTHPQAEREIKRQWGTLAKDKSFVDRPTYFDELPNFSRSGPNRSSPFKSRGWDL